MDILRIQEPERKASGRQGPVKILLRTSEIAMIVIGGIIFLATVVTLVVICNVKQSKYSISQFYFHSARLIKIDALGEEMKIAQGLSSRGWIR